MGKTKMRVDLWLKIFGLFTGDMKAIFEEPTVKQLNGGALRKLANIIRLFFILIFVRGLVFSVVSDDRTAFYLGHKIGEWRHLLMITIFTSIHSFFVQNEMYSANNQAHEMLSWLEPFQLLCGQRTPNKLMTDEMFQRLAVRSKRVFLGSRIAVVIRILFVMIVLLNLYSYDNFRRARDDPYTGPVWIFILLIFIFLQSGGLHMMSACFLVICHYFELQFLEVQSPAESLVDPLQPLNDEQAEDVLMEILYNYNLLCSQIDSYNQFWSRWILWTYFGLPSVTLYCLYQVAFVAHTKMVILVMFVVSIESAIIFILISLAAIRVHEKSRMLYSLLLMLSRLRLTSPFGLKLQTSVKRMVTESIGFYCLNLFHVGKHTFFLLVIGFVQNFFLLTDFITVQNMPLSNATTVPTTTPATG